MNILELDQIRREIESAFRGRRFGRVFPLSKSSLAIDFHPHASSYLFIDLAPGVRTVFLMRRRLKELERASVHSSTFVIGLRQLGGLELASVKLMPGSKSLVLDLMSAESTERNLFLVLQLGGKHANIFVLDHGRKILNSARSSTINGQRIGEIYDAPKEDSLGGEHFREIDVPSLSEVFDKNYTIAETENRFAELAKQARRKITLQLKKLRKLVQNLEKDLANHGSAEGWKRFGDLILANLSNLRRDGDKIIVTDYFDPELGELHIAVDQNVSATEAAESFFKRYTKARNAAVAIAMRLKTINSDINELENTEKRLEAAINARDEQAVMNFLPAKPIQALERKRKEKVAGFRGARRFLSSDDYEILVGKKASDNDYLTFRIAKSFDLWLHAADYPGSHVVVKNPNRKEIPVRTVTEAAQLASFYSDAREQPKVAVNYTQKKFVNKPKRSAPGLVSLSSFKTILVNPMIGNLSLIDG